MIDKHNKKIFDDFTCVDCNDCERWWLNQCDGVKPSTSNSNGSTRVCNGFLATRNIHIPQKIKTQQKQIECLIWWNVVLSLFIIGLIIRVVI